MLKQIRQLHLYLGTFFAPAIIFFSLTGALQTFGLHETPKGSAPRPAIFAKMAQVHIHQRFAEPRQGRPPGPETGNPDAAKPDAGKARAPQEEGEGGAGRSTLPFKVFMLFMSIGLIVTTLLGLYMAFKYNRDRRVTWTLLVLGIIVPVVLLYL